MNKALDTACAILTGIVSKPRIGIQGLGPYRPPSSLCVSPPSSIDCDLIILNPPTPVDVIQFQHLMREADERLKVNGILLVVTGYVLFSQSDIARTRYKSHRSDPMHIWEKISNTETPWFQKSTQTALEHYSYLFDKCVELFPDVESTRVLSFGCSSGEEVRTFKNRGFKNVHGVEINPEAIALARAADPDGLYVEELNMLPIPHIPSYHLIVTMAVLCSFPSRDPVGDFPFSSFVKAIKALDARLLPGGYFLIGSVQYDFRETEIARRYEPILLEDPLLRYYASGRIPKWSAKGYIRPLEATMAEGAVPVLYRKMMT